MSIARDRAARSETPVGKHLPYLAQIDDHTILTRDGHLLQIIELQGLPFETIASAELDARLLVRDAMFQGLASSRFALIHHVVRREVSARLEGDFGDPFSEELDTVWSERLAVRRLYVNDLYLAELDGRNVCSG
jgi:type IV secretion system protein VirB4